LDCRSGLQRKQNDDKNDKDFEGHSNDAKKYPDNDELEEEHYCNQVDQSEIDELIAEPTQKMMTPIQPTVTTTIADGISVVCSGVPPLAKGQ
jgi:hypothetical protein